MLHSGIFLTVVLVGMVVFSQLGLLAAEVMGEQDVSIHQVHA